MNTSPISIVGDLIEVLVSERHVRTLGKYRENRPGISDRNRFSAGCIMCINGQHDNTDGVFAPYNERELEKGVTKFGGELLRVYSRETLHDAPPWKFQDRVFGVNWG